MSGRVLSLRARILAGSILLVMLPAAAATLAVTILGSRAASRSVHDAVARGQQVQAHFQARRAQELALISRIVSSDPAFAGYLAEAVARGEGAGGVPSASIADLLAERQADLGFGFAVALDDEGRLLASTGGPALGGAALAEDPLVRQAAENVEPATGALLLRGKPYQAAIVPVEKDRALIGFLVTGLPVDDALATEMSRVGGVDVLFLALGEDRAPRIVASSVGLARLDALQRAVANASPAILAALDPGLRGPVVELDEDGERLVARLEPIRAADGKKVAWLASLSSADAQVAAFRDIRRVVLGSALLAILAAAGASVLLVRKTMQPVSDLAAAAHAAGGGDYSRRLAVPKDPELARMAGAFNALLRDLQQRREMEAWVADIERRLPEESLETFRRQAAGHGSQQEADDAPDRTRPTAGIAGKRAQDVLAPGETFAERYEIRGVLGQGAAGIVYAAQDKELDEIVALKVLRRGLSGGLASAEMLKSELKNARRITHPNVLRTHDYGEHEGTAYISMENVHGLTLRALLRHRGALPLSPAVLLLRQLCDGLQVAHEAGVVHRDIKPENVMLDRHGRAKLMDFGIAVTQRVDDTDGAGRQWLGTPPYLSPEILAGAEPGVAGDLYALSVMAHEVLTGSLPVPRGDIDAMLLAKREPPPPPSRLRPELPRAIDELIVRALDPDPAHRFKDVAEWRAALMRAQG